MTENGFPLLEIFLSAMYCKKIIFQICLMAPTGKITVGFLDITFGFLRQTQQPNTLLAVERIFFRASLSLL